jgi:ketosteroid isomerase-like protein
MSQENVELARRAFEAWNRGDADAWVELHHPEIDCSLLR